MLSKIFKSYSYFNLNHILTEKNFLYFIISFGIIFYSIGSYLRPFSAPDQLTYVFDFYSPLIKLSPHLFYPSTHTPPSFYYGCLQLIHWLGHQSIQLFRLPNLLLFIITTLLTGKVGRYLWQPFTGNLAAIIMLTCLGNYLSAQTISPEVFAALMNGLGLLIFLKNIEQPFWINNSIAYLLFAVGYMSMGLWSLLFPISIIVAWLITQPKLPPLKTHLGILLIPLSLIIWHSIAPNPQQEWLQGWHSLLTTYYTPSWKFLLGGLLWLPWSVFLINSLWFMHNPLWTATQATSSHRFFLKMWLIIPFFLCLFAHGSSLLWLIVSSPALALNLAPYFQCIWEKTVIPNFVIPLKLLKGFFLATLIILGLIAFSHTFILITLDHLTAFQLITTFLILLTFAGRIALRGTVTFSRYFYWLSILAFFYGGGLTLVYQYVQNKPIHFYFFDQDASKELTLHAKQITPLSSCSKVTSLLSR